MQVLSKNQYCSKNRNEKGNYQVTVLRFSIHKRVNHKKEKKTLFRLKVEIQDIFFCMLCLYVKTTQTNRMPPTA